MSHTGILNNQPSRSSSCCFSLLYMHCVNITLAEHAFYTVLCSTITTLGYHHTSSTSTGAAISSAFPFHCFTSLSSGPLTTFQMAFHGFHGKDQSNKKRDLLPLFTLHDFMFSEKKMKKVMKSIEDSFEYTQRSNEFEQIHNTPEKIMKQICPAIQ